MPQDPRPEDDDIEDGRYVALKMTDDGIVVYDAEVETAWVRSDCSMDLDRME